MYIYIQCSVIGQSVFIVDDKIISSTVAPVNYKKVMNAFVSAAFAVTRPTYVGLIATFS